MIIGTKVRVVNPESRRYGQIGEIVGVPEIYGLSLEERVRYIKKEYEYKLREAYVVRFEDGVELSFGVRELQPAN